MEQYIKNHFVITLVSLSVVSLILSNNYGVNLEITALILSALTFASILFLEKKIPFRENWNHNVGDLNTDINSAVMLITVVDPMVKLLIPLLIITVYKLLNLERTEISLPLLAQVMTVTFIIEFGKYWSHRLHHRLPSLWWLHAMHHSSKRLYVVNSLRFHPLNYVINSMAGLLPVMLIGFSPNSILGYLILTQPLVLIQHANIDFKSGWANYIFSTNEAHRWHHSTRPSTANRNYGNAILIWDHIFGTFKASQGFSKEEPVGLFSDSSDYPANAGYWQQLLSMFSTLCCRGT